MSYLKLKMCFFSPDRDDFVQRSQCSLFGVGPIPTNTDKVTDNLLQVFRRVESSRLRVALSALGGEEPRRGDSPGRIAQRRLQPERLERQSSRLPATSRDPLLQGAVRDLGKL